MSEWKEYKLGEVADVQTGPFGSQLHMDDYKEIGTPIITVEHIGDNRIIHNNLPLVGDEDKERLKKYTLREGDIVFSRVGSVDRRAFVSSRENGWLFSGRCLRVRPLHSVNSRYLSYFFGLEGFKETIRRIAVGATMPSINTSILSNVTVYLPHLDEQRRIAGVLSSLDDKIDLLNRENATLEALAETLFRHYFIENPNPAWKEVSLSSIATFLNGLACQKYSPKDLINRLPVLKIKELSSGITKDSDWATTDVGEEYIVHCGDVIFAWSASLMVKIWNGEDCVLNQHLFKVTSDIFPRWYYYLWCKYHLQEFISIALSHATTMGHIKRGDLDSSMVLVPSRNEMKTFTKQIEPLLERVEINYSQINNLSIYRDNLLPRLMNGEVKIVE